jgi:predicted methyltransferase
MKIIIGSLLLIFSLGSNAAGLDTLQQILIGDHRSAVHKARDQYRHPQQTLAFFDVQPNMTVVEIWPGGAGWYTEILAPLLKDHGKLYAAHFAADSKIPFFTANLEKFKQKIQAQEDIYGNIELTVLQPPKHLTLAPAGSADRVLTFRNVHNWMKSGHAEIVFQAMYRALKPGGLLGVVEHRNAVTTKQDPKALSGYVTEDAVIKLARNAGFELVAKSAINANPKDDRKHPAGVWTLPPTFRLKDKDREKYLQIGESDRMTLKFIKPLK